MLNFSGQKSVQDGVTVVRATYDNSKAVKAIVSLLSSVNMYGVKHVVESQCIRFHGV